LSSYKFSIGEEVDVKWTVSGKTERGTVENIRNGYYGISFPDRPRSKEYPYAFGEGSLTKVPKVAKFKKGDRVRVPKSYGGHETTVAEVYGTGETVRVDYVPDQPNRVHTYSAFELELVDEKEPVSLYTKVIDNLDAEIDKEQDTLLTVQHRIDCLKELRKGMITLRAGKRAGA
jgi:hypothetical protein